MPDDRTILVERFRDELGDWRLVIHSQLGAPVNAPWALAIGARLRERYGFGATDVTAMHSDDGIVLRLPEIDGPPPGADLAIFDADEIASLVTAEVSTSALFASRFRECAARALLLPKRDPRQRAALWQQRQRSNQLLQVAAEYGDFPIVLEAMRECLQDVFDLPGLAGIMRELAERQVAVVEVETPAASPFARSLLFGYVGSFIYDGDAPLAERRAQALSLDSALLAELLGTTDLRELLDPDAIVQVGRELGRLEPNRHARGVDSVHDLLRGIGDLTTSEALARGATAQDLATLEEQRRVIRVRIGGEERWLAIEDAGRVRDALGTALPVGIPEAFTEPTRDPLGDLVTRYARTHGPFDAHAIAERLGLGVAVVTGVLARLTADGRTVQGEFTTDSAATQWCDAEVLRMIRRRSLAALRREVEPVAPIALARFIPAWQGLGAKTGMRGVDGVMRAVEQLAGVPIAASALESLILPSRVPDYSPAMLDELTLAGDVLWAGAGSLPGSDGWLTLAPTELAPLLLNAPETPATPIEQAVADALEDGHGLFFRSLVDHATIAVDGLSDEQVTAAVWALVWAGQLTNDTLAPIRALLGSAPGARRRTPPRARYSRYSGMASTRAAAAVAPGMGGRWSAVPERSNDTTLRAIASTDALLARYGLLTRGTVMAEGVSGGFSAVYPVLKTSEESGRVRRGYFVEGLGAAQFALPGAVDRLRGFARAEPESFASSTGRRDSEPTLVLAATDPANPYGAALSWPTAPAPSTGGRGHQPARKAGALVVLVDGDCVLYVERGGRSLLSFSDELTLLQPAADALALAVREGVLGKLQVERADGIAVSSTTLGTALESAGFSPTPRGLRLRS